MQTYNAPISPKALDMLQATLNAWCKDRNIKRADAKDEAKILIDLYQRGTRSQLDLLKALDDPH